MFSPKRSRRDGKPETGRVVSNADVGDRADQDEKQRRRLQDALPLDAPSAPDSSKIESGTVIKESDRKRNGHLEGTKHSSDPTEVPRSRSYFQVLYPISFHRMYSFYWLVYVLHMNIRFSLIYRRRTLSIFNSRSSGLPTIWQPCNNDGFVSEDYEYS